MGRGAGLGRPDDLHRIQSEGTVPRAAPEEVSRRAQSQGINQLGTLGAGNHFLEVQRVDKIFDPKIALIHARLRPLAVIKG